MCLSGEGQVRVNSLKYSELDIGRRETCLLSNLKVSERSVSLDKRMTRMINLCGLMLILLQFMSQNAKTMKYCL